MTSSPIFCGNCGAQNSANENFCDSYKYALSTTVTVTTTPSIPTGQLPPTTLLKQRYQMRQTVNQDKINAVYRLKIHN